MTNHWMEGPLKGLFNYNAFSSHRQLADFPTKAVELIPFDITLALTGSVSVDTIALTDAVTQWLNEEFGEEVASVGFRYNFERVVLRTLSTETSSNNNRALMEGSRELQSAYKVTYDGMSYWNTDREVPTETSVFSMQLSAIGRRNALLAKLRAESDSLGLGSALVDARADVNRSAQPPPASRSSDDKSLDVIIVVAIVIAVLASLLLIFAVLMAWRTGSQQKQRDYNDGALEDDPDMNRRNEHPRSMAVESTTAGPYADSVITDDISSSLSAYYKSGMAGGYRANRSQHGALNDAASVSSMESYGYSLDGYASSIGK